MQAATAEIGGMLREWHTEKCQNGNLGWSSLAKKVGTSPSYLSKLANGANNLPSFEKAKNIYKAIRPLDVPGLYFFLQANYPNKTPSYESFYDEEIKTIDPECAKHLLDPVSFRIVKLALSEEFTREDLSKIISANDLDARLNALELDGYIQFNKEKKLCRGVSHTRTIATDLANVAQQLKHCLDLLLKKKTENALYNTPYDTKANTLSFFHEALNDDGIAKMVELSQDFMQNNHKVLRNPKYKGNTPVFVNLVTGRFDSL